MTGADDSALTNDLPDGSEWAATVKRLANDLAAANVRLHLLASEVLGEAGGDAPDFDAALAEAGRLRAENATLTAHDRVDWQAAGIESLTAGHPSERWAVFTGCDGDGPECVAVVVGEHLADAVIAAFIDPDEPGLGPIGGVDRFEAMAMPDGRVYVSDSSDITSHAELAARLDAAHPEADRRWRR